MNHILLKTILVVIGFVLGAAVMFGIMKLTEGTSGDDDNTSTANGTRVTDSLQYIAVMSRHGNRGGSVDYPNDPYPIGDVTYWPYGANQMTNYGRQKEYNLGKRLRSLYNGFLNTTYSPVNINSKTDDVERVVYSGELVLQGLFPPEGFQKWDSNINWQPVVLFTNSSDRSTVLSKNCERFNIEQDRVISIFDEKYATNISALIQYFYDYSNETVDSEDLIYIFEKMYSEVEEGYTLPSELSGVYPEPLTEFYIKNNFAMVAGTEEMVRLRIGELYDEILNVMESKINGSAPDVKMNYYSAHDCSILSLQLALGMARDCIISWVKVGSAIIIELHKDFNSGQYYVEVIYLNGSSLDSDPVSLSLPACGEPCYYGALVNSTRAFTNVSFEQECQITSSSSTTPRDIPLTSVATNLT